MNPLDRPPHHGGGAAAGVTLMRRRVLLGVAVASPALAQGQGPGMRMVVPFPPGGATDVFARRLAGRMAAVLGQAVVVENRGGAAGAIGTLEAVRARPDGQTILFATASTLGLYPLMAERPVFDPLRDLAPVSLVGAATVAFAVRPEVATDLQGLIAAARARPGALKYGSPGSGSYLHLSMELLKREAGGVDMLHVPYRGSAPAMTDLLGGHLDAISDTVATAIENHRAGRIRILAVATRARSPLLPEIPTVAEALNLPGFEAAVWMAVMLPLGVAEPVRERLSHAIGAALAEPATRAELEQAGFVLDPRGNPDEVRSFMAAEQEKWRPLVRATGVRLE